MKEEHEPERPKLNLKQDFKRGNDLFTFEFNEHSSRYDTARRIKNAFIEGFTCFLFKFHFPKQKRSFETRVALPPSAGFDEVDAWEMGVQAFDKFLNTVAQLADQERRGVVEQINADD